MGPLESAMSDFLRECGGVAVIDGGLATELERHGADLNDPLWSAKCILTSPHLIRTVRLPLPVLCLVVHLNLQVYCSFEW